MLGPVLVGVVSLGVGIAAYLLGLGAVMAVTAAALAVVVGVFVVRYETVLGNAQPRPEHRQARSAPSGSDHLVHRRRAADWRRDRGPAEPDRPDAASGVDDIQAG